MAARLNGDLQQPDHVHAVDLKRRHEVGHGDLTRHGWVARLHALPGTQSHADARGSNGLGIASFQAQPSQHLTKRLHGFVGLDRHAS
jgi:hypothetical protein